MQLQTDQIPDERILQIYSLLEFKGKGAYGVVWKAIDKQTKKVLALKKVFDAFSNNTDAQRTYREVVFLKQLQDHENIVKLFRIHRASNMKDLYMTFEYMETDLHKVIRANILHQQHITYILYQLLKAIKYLHSGNLLHRDLKPSNLLVDADCKVKIADFGLARSINSQDETPILTEYVATRWYRAPEILLGSHTYTKAVDMWSVGLILAEMITKKSLFSGTSTINQIEKIIELLGKPTSDDLLNLQCPLADQIFDHLTSKKRTTFVQQFQGASELQIDFIRKCLTWNPSRRMSVDQALNHQLIDDYRGTEAEKILIKDLLIPFKENIKQDVKSYRECLYAMDKDYHQITKVRVRTLPESRLSTDAIPQQIIKPSPCHNRYFSQNKIQAPPTPLRSKSFHNPNNNNNNNNTNTNKNLNSNINPNPNNGSIPQNQIQSVQKILQTYLKPKHNFTVKKRSRVIVEQSVLKKNLAKNYFDAGSMISFQK